MLNKELFFAVGSPTIEGHTKIIVGSNITDVASYGWYPESALTKVPQWYNTNKTSLVPLIALASFADGVSIKVEPTQALFKEFSRVLYDTIKIKILETGVTVTLQVGPLLTNASWYTSNSRLFTAADVGKVLTLEFDPPPDGYL